MKLNEVKNELYFTKEGDRRHVSASDAVELLGEALLNKNVVLTVTNITAVCDTLVFTFEFSNNTNKMTCLSVGKSVQEALENLVRIVFQIDRTPADKVTQQVANEFKGEVVAMNVNPDAARVPKALKKVTNEDEPKQELKKGNFQNALMAIGDCKSGDELLDIAEKIKQRSWTPRELRILREALEAKALEVE